MTVREAFRRERGRLWQTDSRLANDLLDFADAVCLYARGGDWTWGPCPVNPAIVHGYQQRTQPDYTDLQARCRRLLFPAAPDPWVERLRKFTEDLWR